MWKSFLTTNNQQVMARYVLLFLTACGIVGSGCGRTPTSPPDDNSSATLEQRAKGTWVWRKTVRAFIAETTTPESCGCTQELVFGDSLSIYRNDTLESRSPYTITDCRNGGDVRADSIGCFVVGTVGIGFSRPTIQIRNDTLVISNAAVDGPTMYYTRREE